MKITIQVGGRFHAFNLAYQLEKRGYLHKLITSYPKFETVKYGIPKNKIESILIKEVLHRAWNKLPSFVTNLYNPNPIICDIFDKFAERKIDETDIFVGWSSFSLYSLRYAKSRGALIILERGSSHIKSQKEILLEEYNKYNINIRLPHPKIIEKELKEYEEADYISIPSKFVKRTFLERGIPESKLIQVPYGVNLSEFKQIPKEDDIFRVIFIGGMSLRKGVHYLLQGFSELNLPNSELWLIGSMNNEIEPFFEKYNVGEGKIKYLGHKKQKDLHKYYSQGSVFVIMSIEEGLALVQPQAMACGLPVICTTNTGGEDIVREGKDGFVIPIRDVETLKEKLVYLYENPEKCKAMGQSAKERVSTGFTWDDYGEKIVEKYENIFNNSVLKVKEGERFKSYD